MKQVANYQLSFCIQIVYFLLFYDNFFVGSAKYCFRRQEKVDSSEKSILEWTVDSQKEIITFDVTTTQTGNGIGLGFSHTGDVSTFSKDDNIDFVTGGVDNKGNSFLHDMTIKMGDSGNLVLENDKQQDYRLLKLSSNSSHLRVQFCRKWNTEDNHDLTFDMSLVHIFWLGESSQLRNLTKDDFTVSKAYFLDPNFSQLKQSLKTWRIARNMQIPNKTTSYWCTIHKPEERFKEKHHVIGFKTLMSNEAARKHTHHIVLYKCNPTTASFDAKSTFDPLINYEGEECYYILQRKLPIQQCRTFMYAWAYGGMDLFLPDHVGFPIGETEDEYYLLETHYDNPYSLSDLDFEVGLEIVYTSNVRTHDAGLVMIGYDISPSLVIPPKSEDVPVYGHCKPNCTNKFIPGEGINVFGVLLHSHMSGIQVRFGKLDTGNEDTDVNLITYDNFYDFNFQQTRLLYEEEKVYPGDHLAMGESICNYNTTWKNGTTFGGFSTREEMCLGFVWYYPKIQNFNRCQSGISFSAILKEFGIEKAALSSSFSYNEWRWIVQKPEILQNTTLQSVIDDEFKRDHNLRNTTLRYYKQNHLQLEHC